MRKEIIALDGDGVLLDYHVAYSIAWQRAFGALPGLRDPDAYWPHDRWDVPWLEGEQLIQLRSKFDEQFWSSIPAIPGALDACKDLVGAGYVLVCVTALAFKFQAARGRNLLDLGFPIQTVITTSNELIEGVSPKAKAVEDVKAVAFVDDYLPYHQRMPQKMHLALITRETKGSPNVGQGLNTVHSIHKDLREFARYWLNRG